MLEKNTSNSSPNSRVLYYKLCQYLPKRFKIVIYTILSCVLILSFNLKFQNLIYLPDDKNLKNYRLGQNSHLYPVKNSNQETKFSLHPNEKSVISQFLSRSGLQVSNCQLKHYAVENPNIFASTLLGAPAKFPKSNYENFLCYYDESNDVVYLPYHFVKHFTDISHTVGVKNLAVATTSSALPDSNSLPQIQVDFLDDKTENIAHQNSNLAKFNISLAFSYTDPSKFILPYGTHYDLNSGFINFASFQVERRSRVKCQDSVYDLPVTTQWDKNGYFYVTQICQFALSYYSRNFNEINDFAAGKLNSTEPSKITTTGHKSFSQNEQKFKTYKNSLATHLKISSLKKSIFPELKFDLAEKKSALITMKFSESYTCREDTKPTTVFLKVILGQPEAGNSTVSVLLKYKLRNCILQQFAGQKSQKHSESSSKNSDSDFIFYETYPIKDKCEGVLTYAKDLKNSNRDLDLTIVLYGTGPFYRIPYHDISKYLKLSENNSNNKNHVDKIKNLGLTSNFYLKRIEYISSTTEDEIDFKISDSPELEYFWQAVEYLSKTYDEVGGYQMPIARTLPGYGRGLAGAAREFSEKLASKS